MCAATTITTQKTSSEPLAPPVITIDGPSGTGKGTICQMIARKLDWHYLDSGSLYRVLAYAALQSQTNLDNEQELQALANDLPLKFRETDNIVRIVLGAEDVSELIRSELCGNTASKIGVFPKVRQALLDRQRAFRQLPGLVTDGRDMGTVIFPDAQLKFFLLASTTERAERRYRQLKKAGVHASLETILQDLEQRDLRDKQRGVAPLKPASDAIIIDNTELSIEEVLHTMMKIIKETFSTVSIHDR